MKRLALLALCLGLVTWLTGCCCCCPNWGCGTGCGTGACGAPVYPGAYNGCGTGCAY